MIAGLNSVEPLLFNVTEVEYFMDDEEAKSARRPVVVRLAKERLALLEQARAGRDWFGGDAFTVADLMRASILQIADRLALLEELPALAAWQSSILLDPHMSGPSRIRRPSLPAMRLQTWVTTCSRGRLRHDSCSHQTLGGR